jgi:hypothetical protein
VLFIFPRFLSHHSSFSSFSKNNSTVAVNLFFKSIDRHSKRNGLARAASC